jgi:excinuclease UvrABC helicase subunit UvrB
LIKALEQEMFELAKDLEFERAAMVRDEIRKINERDGG